MSRRLSQYSGTLTTAQIAEGMNGARMNARRLTDDARSMLERGRLPSAVALAALAIEEAGKLTVLRELALARDAKELATAWREYRQHTSKNQHWLLVDTFLRGASKLQDFGHLFNPDSEHPQVLDHLKQLSFYTDCLGGGRWSFPDEIIDEDLAKMLVQVAEVLSHSHQITTEEVELWIHYMQPVYKTTREAMENALVAWDKEMRARGLLQGGGFTMEDFVSTGIKLPDK